MLAPYYGECEWGNMCAAQPPFRAFSDVFPTNDIVSLFDISPQDKLKNPTVAVTAK